MAILVLSDSISFASPTSPVPRWPQLIAPFEKKKQQQKEFKTVGFADLDDTSSSKKGRKKTPPFGEVLTAWVLLAFEIV